MLCFIILNWNKSKLTISTVNNILAVEHGRYGIIVVDNASDYAERDMLVTYAKGNGWTVLKEEIFEDGKAYGVENMACDDHRILLLANDNYGYAKGNNMGLKLARKLGYKWGVVMNNDVILEIPVLETLLKSATFDSKIAMIGPRIVGRHGERQSPGFDRPSLYDMFFLPILYPVLYPIERIRRLILGKTFSNVSRSEVYFPYTLQGSFMLLELGILENVGWFDENTFLYAEEIILSEKLFRNDYKVAYVDKVYVRHLHGVTTQTLGRRRVQRILESTLYYFRVYRNYGSIRLFLVKAGVLYINYVLDPVLRKIKRGLLYAQRHNLSRRFRNKALPNDDGDK